MKKRGLQGRHNKQSQPARQSRAILANLKPRLRQQFREAAGSYYELKLIQFTDQGIHVEVEDSDGSPKCVPLAKNAGTMRVYRLCAQLIDALRPRTQRCRSDRNRGKSTYKIGALRCLGGYSLVIQAPALSVSVSEANVLEQYSARLDEVKGDIAYVHMTDSEDRESLATFKAPLLERQGISAPGTRFRLELVETDGVTFPKFSSVVSGKRTAEESKAAFEQTLERFRRHGG